MGGSAEGQSFFSTMLGRREGQGTRTGHRACLPRPSVITNFSRLTRISYSGCSLGFDLFAGWGSEALSGDFALPFSLASIGLSQPQKV